MCFGRTHTVRLRRCISDELNSKAHSRRITGPDNVLIAFKNGLISAKIWIRPQKVIKHKVNIFNQLRYFTMKEYQIFYN